MLYWRQVYVLGWPMDHFIHSVSTGSLLLFTFFMISDPRTSPNHPVARILWAVLIAAVSFYLAAFKWKYNTIIWVLVAAAPLVHCWIKFSKQNHLNGKQHLLINHSQLFRSWRYKLKKIVMKPFLKKLSCSYHTCSNDQP